MTRRRIAIVLGTRPEAIKMAPVYLELTEDRRTEVTLVATAQHREMMDQVLSVFGITPDVDLDLMQPNQTLAEVSARVITGVQAALARLAPDAVLVHGDTSTCFFAALAAFYQQIPVGHVEAGLRTYDFTAPWPEEMNRRLTDPICRWCFASTARARENLLAESIPDDNIIVTGNTVVDALLIARDQARRRPPAIPGLSAEMLANRRLVLVTGHRRESFGRPFEEFCLALREIGRRHDDVVLVYPVHLNPNVQRPVYQILAREERVCLIPPLEYLSFVSLMDRSYMIITDSGGIQEEAPSLAKPVLVTRETTERPEAVAAGLAKLVGTSRQRIVAEAERLLTDREAYARMSHGQNPYGDGRAAHRIVDALCESLGRRTRAKQPVSLAASKGCGP
jgi:UDP-N-acetylglucosamine 2-epimerase (hydrolysing)